MAKGTAYRWINENGKEFKRSSLRPYTHVVVGIYDFEGAAARAGEQAATWIDNYKFAKKFVASNGELYGAFKTAEQKAKDVLHEQAILDSAPNAEEYAALRIKEAQEKILAGTYETEALGWSMSLANAQKAVTQFSKYHKHVRVVALKPATPNRVTYSPTIFGRMDEATAAARPEDYILAYHSPTSGTDELFYALTPDPESIVTRDGYTIMRRPGNICVVCRTAQVPLGDNVCQSCWDKRPGSRGVNA